MDPGIRTGEQDTKIINVRAEMRQKRSTMGFKAANEWNMLINFVVEAENFNLKSNWERPGD